MPSLSKLEQIEYILSSELIQAKDAGNRDGYAGSLLRFNRFVLEHEIPPDLRYIVDEPTAAPVKTHRAAA